MRPVFVAPPPPCNRRSSSVCFTDTGAPPKARRIGPRRMTRLSLQAYGAATLLGDTDHDSSVNAIAKRGLCNDAQLDAATSEAHNTPGQASINALCNNNSNDNGAQRCANGCSRDTGRCLPAESRRVEHIAQRICAGHVICDSLGQLFHRVCMQILHLDDQQAQPILTLTDMPSAVRPSRPGVLTLLEDVRRRERAAQGGTAHGSVTEPRTAAAAAAARPERPSNHRYLSTDNKDRRNNAETAKDDAMARVLGEREEDGGSTATACAQSESGSGAWSTVGPHAAARTGLSQTSARPVTAAWHNAPLRRLGELEEVNRLNLHCNEVWDRCVTHEMMVVYYVTRILKPYMDELQMKERDSRAHIRYEEEVARYELCCESHLAHVVRTELAAWYVKSAKLNRLAQLDWQERVATQQSGGDVVLDYKAHGDGICWSTSGDAAARAEQRVSDPTQTSRASATAATAAAAAAAAASSFLPPTLDSHRIGTSFTIHYSRANSLAGALAPHTSNSSSTDARDMVRAYTSNPLNYRSHITTYRNIIQNNTSNSRAPERLAMSSGALAKPPRGAGRWPCLVHLAQDPSPRRAAAATDTLGIASWFTLLNTDTDDRAVLRRQEQEERAELGRLAREERARISAWQRRRMHLERLVYWREMRERALCGELHCLTEAHAQNEEATERRSGDAGEGLGAVRDARDAPWLTSDASSDSHTSDGRHRRAAAAAAMSNTTRHEDRCVDHVRSATHAAAAYALAHARVMHDECAARELLAQTERQIRADAQLQRLVQLDEPEQRAQIERVWLICGADPVWRQRSEQLALLRRVSALPRCGEALGVLQRAIRRWRAGRLGWRRSHRQLGAVIAAQRYSRRCDKQRRRLRDCEAACNDTLQRLLEEEWVAQVNSVVSAEQSQRNEWVRYEDAIYRSFAVQWEGELRGAEGRAMVAQLCAREALARERLTCVMLRWCAQNAVLASWVCVEVMAGEEKGRGRVLARERASRARVTAAKKIAPHSP